MMINTEERERSALKTDRLLLNPLTIAGFLS
jgi:hypothetical protein